jgi:hypothetical protein
VEAGRGNDQTSVLRISALDYWRKPQSPAADWRLAGYWELSGAIWDNPDESSIDLAVTPVLRIERTRIYAEAGIGLHLVSHRISAARVFSTIYQFGDHVGAGCRFGPGGRYDLGLRIQHISNGGVRSPNPGINFLLVRLQYDLE